MRRLLTLAALAVVVLLATTACSSPITAAKLQAAIGPSFARFYAEHQNRLGQVVPARGPDGNATCYRIGPHPFSGAGDDWLCTVLYPYPDGHLQKVFYEVTVAPTGCYTADGPSGIVGPQALRTPSGATVVNPLFAFDGCIEL